jgi:hypothetical protein
VVRGDTRVQITIQRRDLSPLILDCGYLRQCVAIGDLARAPVAHPLCRTIELIKLCEKTVAPYLKDSINRVD